MKSTCYVVDTSIRIGTDSIILKYTTNVWIKNKIQIYFTNHLNQSKRWIMHDSYQSCKSEFKYLIKHGLYINKRSYENLFNVKI
jgi:hypothetical protein